MIQCVANMSGVKSIFSILIFTYKNGHILFIIVTSLNFQFMKTVTLVSQAHHSKSMQICIFETKLPEI